MARSNQKSVPLTLTLLRGLFKVASPILPCMMGHFAYTLWITPTKGSTTPLENNKAATAKTRQLNIAGKRIQYWQWGNKGPVVLFIHGWGGRGTQIAGGIDALIEAGFQVVSFDMPAHGLSDGKTTNAFDMAKVLDGIIKEIGDLYAVITHSFGGLIFSYYYHQSLPLQKIVMICPMTSLEIALEQFCATLRLSDCVKRYLRKNIEDIFGLNVSEQLSAVKNAKKISQPTLVIHDKQDDVSVISNGYQMNEALANSEMIETTGLGHRRILDDEQVVGHIIHHLTS